MCTWSSSGLPPATTLSSGFRFSCYALMRYFLSDGITTCMAGATSLEVSKCTLHSANWLWCYSFHALWSMLCCMTVQVLQNYPCVQCPSTYGTAWFKDVMAKVHNCVYVPISSLQLHACPCRHITFWFQLTCPHLPIMHCWGVRLGFGLEQDYY